MGVGQVSVIKQECTSGVRMHTSLLGCVQIATEVSVGVEGTDCYNYCTVRPARPCGIPCTGVRCMRWPA